MHCGKRLCFLCHFQYNRTLSKCDPLVAKGAKLAKSPIEVAQNSDIVFSIVGSSHSFLVICSYPSDVREITLGEKGILKGLKVMAVLECYG